MKQNTFEAIRAAFTGALGRIQGLPAFPGEERLEFRRQTDGRWVGSLVVRPSFAYLHLVHGIEGLASAIEPALKQDYPQHVESLGTSACTGALQPSAIIYKLISEAHASYGTFALTDEQINALMENVSSFFDRETVCLRLYAPASNLKGSQSTPPVTLPGGIILRPISDEECTRFYGGSPPYLASQFPVGIPEFVFVKDAEVPKVIGTQGQMKGLSVLKTFQDGLDLCILALATFKEGGAVGYEGIHVFPAEFAFGAAFGGQGIRFNERVPHGDYEIAPAERPDIEAHARLFEGIHDILEMASQRLADSSRRTKPRDAIIDAVIGMETILLGGREIMTELRFRFSLRYASLFKQEERRAAFLTAKGLYNLRSKIAHGGRPGESVEINGRSMTLHDAAKLARSTLRTTIRMFLGNSVRPDFIRSDYWTARELGLQESTDGHEEVE